MVYFQIHNSSGELELWKSDGSVAGTIKITNIEPAISNKPPLFCFCNDLLFFISQDQTTGQELWRTDGTAAGTWRVKDINPGTAPGVYETSDLTCFKDKVYFSGDNGVDAEEPWVSDGSLAGTHMLKNLDLRPGYSGYPQGFTVVGDYLYFTSDNQAFGRELFRTDGTASGTEIVSDIYQGQYGALDIYSPDKIANDGISMFFKAYEPQNGGELWTSMGMLSDTRLLADVDTGKGPYTPYSSKPNYITPVRNHLCFSANEFPFASSAEFCVIDKNGFNLRCFDLRNPGSSFPLHFYSAMGKVFFSADDGVNGRELWVFEPSESRINSFTLVDAVTNMDLMTIEENDVINLAALPHKKLNIRANLDNAGQNASVKFYLDGSLVRTENQAPFALAGDSPTGNYHSWEPTPGEYSLMATPYSGQNSIGESGLTSVINFIVVDVSFGITHLTLVDAETNTDYLNFRVSGNNNSYPNDLQIIDVSGLAVPHKLNIRANVFPLDIDYVDFGLDGDDYARTEAVAPYALFGDRSGDYYAWYDKHPQKNIPIAEHYLVMWAEKGSQTFLCDAYFKIVDRSNKLASLALVDANTNEILRSFEVNDYINLNWFATTDFNIVAYTIPETVPSVSFAFKRTSPVQHYTGARTYENHAPYALFGDASGNFNPWTAEPGIYELTATPYSLKQHDKKSIGRGISGIPLDIIFQLFDSGVPKASLNLADTRDEKVLELYPNPTSGILNINFNHDGTGTCLLQVVDLAGRDVIVQKLEKNNSQFLHHNLDLSSLRRGLYFIRLNFAGEDYSTKVMVDGK